MNYSQTFIGRSLEELEYQDIQEYFEVERIETDQLEFKSINEKGTLNEKFPSLIRSICAFANSSGGLLIWGAPVGIRPEGRQEKIFTGALTHLSEAIEKDFLISKVSDSIIPLPEGITVKILNNDDNYIAVFEIQESEYAPHQTNDRYYMRIDGQTKPAPHHYIEALFRRIKFPNIENVIKITDARSVGNNYQIEFDLYFFNWSPLENEENLSIRVVTDHGVFPQAQNPAYHDHYRMDGHEYYVDPLKDVFHYGEPIRENNVIIVNPHGTLEDNLHFKIMVMFGGKKSPMKSSEYTLDLSRIHDYDPNNMIIERKENRTMFDIQREKGVNKQDIINRLFE